MRVEAKIPAYVDWKRTPARYLFERQNRAVRPADEIVTAFRDGRVMPRSLRRTEGFTNAVQEIGYQGVRSGDLVIHSMDGFAGAIGVAEADGKASPVVHAYRPQRSADPRYYAYLLRVLAQQGFVGALAKGIRERSTAFDAETFRGLVLPEPSPPEQRAIVGYLDTETARIDALIAKKQRLADLLQQRFWTFVQAEILAVAQAELPLRRLLVGITDGPFGSSLTSAHYANEGARVVRLGNIGFAEFKSGDHAFISEEHYDTLRRHAVRVGNLLIAGLGDARNHVGRACVAPDLGDAIVKADCYCATVDPGRADARFLAFFLSSPLGAEAVSVAARGTTRSRINLEIAKEIRVPRVSLEEQRRLVRVFGARRATVNLVTSQIQAQLKLVSEHRQALITAAVTGELEITGASR